MAEENHERFEELALGHVLGGLPSDDAAAFRAHLVECRDCRLRVAELRDIAEDLAATEREEKHLAAVATQVAEREPEVDDGGAPGWRRSRWIPVVAVVAIISVLGILFWNYHLRRVTTEYASVVQRQEEVLQILSSGDPLEVVTAQGVTAAAATDGASVAVSVTGFPPEVVEGYLVIWLLEGGEVVGDPMGGSGHEPAAFVVEADGADELVVTGHRAGAAAPEEPGDAPLLRVDTSPAD